MLILRELLLGPKRFSELLERLPAMGTNRLSQRLATLSEAGVIERTSADRTAGYTLTAWGEGLRPILFDLIRWGFRLMLQPVDGDRARAEIITLGLTALVDPLDEEVSEVYDFLIGEERFHVEFAGGRYSAHSGAPASDVDARVDGSLEEFLDTIMGGGERLTITVKQKDASARIGRLLSAPAARLADLAPPA